MRQYLSSVVSANDVPHEMPAPRIFPSPADADEKGRGPGHCAQRPTGWRGLHTPEADGDDAVRSTRGASPLQ